MSKQLAFEFSNGMLNSSQARSKKQRKTIDAVMFNAGKSLAAMQRHANTHRYPHLAALRPAGQEGKVGHSK